MLFASSRTIYLPAHRAQGSQAPVGPSQAARPGVDRGWLLSVGFLTQNVVRMVPAPQWGHRWTRIQRPCGPVQGGCPAGFGRPGGCGAGTVHRGAVLPRLRDQDEASPGEGSLGTPRGRPPTCLVTPAVR